MDFSLYFLSPMIFIILAIPFLLVTFFLPDGYQNSTTYGVPALFTLLLLLAILRLFESSAPGSATRKKAKELLTLLSMLLLLESNYATVAYLNERGGDLVSVVDGVVFHGCFLLLFWSLILLHVPIWLNFPTGRWFRPAMGWLVAAAVTAAFIYMLVASGHRDCEIIKFDMPVLEE